MPKVVETEALISTTVVWGTYIWHPETNNKEGCKMETVIWLQM